MSMFLFEVQGRLAAAQSVALAGRLASARKAALLPDLQIQQVVFSHGTKVRIR